MRCKTGGAVRVPVATGPLASFADGLILAVPPFYSSLSGAAAPQRRRGAPAPGLRPGAHRDAAHGRRHAGRARRRGRGGRRRATRECLAAEAPAVQASIETLLEQDEGESAIQYAPQTIRFCVLDDDVGETVDAALDEALTWNMT